MSGLFDSNADLAKVVRGLPPELGNELTFHLPLEIQALEVAGADSHVILDRIAQRLPVAFSAALVDPPFYRWAEEHYRDEAEALLSDDPERRLRAFGEVASLGAGLAGAAFHALIRTGFGALRHDAHELARGLAYLRTRRQVLFSGPIGDRAPELIDLPSSLELNGSSVFSRLNLVAGERGLFIPDEPIQSPPPIEELVAIAFDLVRRDPGSFISVHTVTGLHGLVELDHLLTGRRDLTGVPTEPLLLPWWRAMAQAITASAVLIDAEHAAPPSRPVDSFATLEQMTHASIESCEAHDVKISVALSRLVEFGLTTPAEAITVGTAKLAATECTAR